MRTRLAGLLMLAIHLCATPLIFAQSTAASSQLADLPAIFFSYAEIAQRFEPEPMEHKREYQLQIGMSPESLRANKPDQWDSGRVVSDQSVGVAYGGPALEPTKRYYWRVKAWDKDGKAYPDSEISWFETGLLDEKNWQGKWIGYEEEELRRVMEADAPWISNPRKADFKATADVHHNFRFKFDLSKEIKKAALFVTAQDSGAAWVNGKQILAGRPLPPWKQPPSDASPANLRPQRSRLRSPPRGLSGKCQSLGQRVELPPQKACGS